MAVGAHALCALADVRAYLQKDVADVEQDPIIESLIDRASRAIIDYCRREFAPKTTDAEARKYYYRGGGHLDLTPYDLRSFTDVQIDTDTADPISLVENTDFWVAPRPSRDDLIMWFEIETYDTTDARPRREVTITGQWGFDSVPDDVKHAAIITVVTWLRNDVAAFSTTFNMDENRVERPEALPSAVRGTLAAYKRTGVA